MSIDGTGATDMARALFNVPAKTTGTASASTKASSPGGTSMTKQLSTPDLFLKLLMAELQHENPTHPTTASSILQQTAELSQIESITTMTTALDQQRQYVEAGDATSLIGKQVTATVTGKPVTGTVTRVALSSTGTPVLEIGSSAAVPLASVTAVGAVAPQATTSTPSTPSTSTSTLP